VKDQHL